MNFTATHTTDNRVDNNILRAQTAIRYSNDERANDPEWAASKLRLAAKELLEAAELLEAE